VRPLGFRTDDRTLRRAGLDYWQHLVWEVVDSWDELTGALGDSARLWMFSKQAERPFTDVHFQLGDALVFGSETSGLPASLLSTRASHNLRIPTSPHVRSLNLSCAVAVAAYELDRQVRLTGAAP